MAKPFIIIHKKKYLINLVMVNCYHNLTKKNIVYNFRQNDIKNGGEGAPLTPIFHQLIATSK